MALFYIILGVLAMLLELFIPGGVTFCFGLSAFLTGGMIHLGWIDTLPMSFMVCGIMAVGFVIPMQFLFKSFCVGATSKSNIDEDVDCFGKIVVVIHDIGEEHNNGRINFQGTEWAACSHQGSIDAGGKAKIIGRENLVWVVEAL